MPMVLDTSKLTYAIDRTITALFFNAFMRGAPQAARVFGMFPSDTYMESFGSTGGVGEFTEKTPLQRPDTDAMRQQFRVDFFHKEYAKELPIERALWQDARFNIIAENGKALGQAAVRTNENLAAATLDGGFDATKSEDGVALFSDSHVNVDGDATIDNLSTLELTYDNVTTVANDLMLQTDYDGDLIDAEANTMIVPVNKQQKAFEIIRSSGSLVNAANRDASWHQGRYTAVVWGRLDKLATTNSTTRWYLADNRYLDDIFKWFWRVPPEVATDGDLLAGKRSVAGYWRSSWGAVMPFGIIGNNAST